MQICIFYCLNYTQLNTTNLLILSSQCTFCYIFSHSITEICVCPSSCPAVGIQTTDPETHQQNTPTSLVIISHLNSVERFSYSYFYSCTSSFRSF